MKKILASIMVLCMMFTLVVSAETVEFTDIDDAWAKDYITRAAELGIITGYQDNTFKPMDNITKFETVILLSRLYEIDEDLLEEIEEKYLPIVEEITDGQDEWAHKDLAVSLAIDLLSVDTFRTIYENETIKNKATREEVAVFAIRAMGLEDEANDLSNELFTLPFDDSSSIRDDYRPYVYLIDEEEIMSGNDGNFSPKNNITRQELAKVVCELYDYIDENEVEPDFDEFTTYVDYKGVIESITPNPIESIVKIKLDDSEENHSVRVNSDTKIEINGKASDVEDLEKGMLITCTASLKDNIATEIEIDTTTVTIDGIIKSIYTSTPMKLVVEIINEDGDEDDEPFTIAGNVPVTLDGEEIDFDELNKNDIITMRMVDGIVTRIDSTSRIQTYTGVIEDIVYDIPITLVINDEKNVKHTFTYVKEPDVVRNSDETTFDQLRIGDEVIVETDYDELDAVTAKSPESSGDAIAVIKEITIGNTNSIRVANDEGEISDYVVSDNAKINILNQSRTIYDLRVGYTVGLKFVGSEVISIEASKTETSQSIEGKIIYVNEEKETLLVRIGNVEAGTDELVTITIESNTHIGTITGSDRNFSGLDPGDDVLCVGAYNGGTFEAISILIK